MDEPTQEQPAKPKKKKSEWAELFTPRTIVATVALFVSTCSLLLTVYQMREDRKAKWASVLPYVTCGVTNGNLYPDSTGHFTMKIFNKGVGPAFIHYVRVVCDGQVFDGDNHSQALQQIGRLDRPVESTYSSVSMMGLMPANSEVMWFEPHDSVQAGRVMTRWWSEEGQRRIDFVICFGDVYGRKWVFHSNTYQITPCDDCPDLPVTKR